MNNTRNFLAMYFASGLRDGFRGCCLCDARTSNGAALRFISDI